jgi:hypothetical protein
MAGHGYWGCCAGGILARTCAPDSDDADTIHVEFDEDLSQEERTAAIKQQVLIELLQASDSDRSLHRKGTRSFTNEQMRDIVDFRREHRRARSSDSLASLERTARHCPTSLTEKSDSRRSTQEPTGFQVQSSGPWGVPSGHGSGINSWGTIDAASYCVRGPNYLRERDKKKAKVPSAESLAELVLVDLFETTEDIPCISRCSAAATLERLRTSGEQRRLLLINFRCNPIHLVLVYALRDPAEGRSPAAGLLESLFNGSMSKDSLRQRLKVIPRPLNMPWLLRTALGETPAIIGKQIPMELFRTERECEISLNIVHSGVARRVLTVLKSGASSLDLELGVLLESQTQDELPEQLIGGFRVTHPDLGTTRLVDPSAESVDSFVPTSGANL